jgi:type IV secretory pathway VirB4 component
MSFKTQCKTNNPIQNLPNEKTMTQSMLLNNKTRSAHKLQKNKQRKKNSHDNAHLPFLSKSIAKSFVVFYF